MRLTIIQALEQFIKNTGGKLPLLLPEKSSVKATAPVLYGSEKGGLSTSAQEAADAAGAATGRIKPPTTSKPPKRFQAPVYEPYGPEKTIDFGKKAPKKPSNLPIIR